MLHISQSQRSVVQLPLNEKIFLEGSAGTGKTTVGVERMLYLMSEGVSGSSILVFVPQRISGIPYIEAMNTPGVVAGGTPRIITLAGLAQRMIDLFWPAVAKVVGFGNPSAPPIFLNYEASQYYMARIVKPFLDEGFFESVTVNRNRIYAQVLDNLNKAAVVGFPYQEIGERLKSAWSGRPGQSHVYDDAQTSASLFREYCLQHNLLDFSLQVEIFTNHLWNSHIVREYLKKSYQHLIVENVEEDVPVAHDVLSDWIPMADSSLVIYDRGGGYRQLLGADPVGAYHLRDLCDEKINLVTSFVMSPEIKSLAGYINHTLVEDNAPLPDIDPRLALVYENHNYYTQMLDWVAEQINSLIHEEGYSPKDIVILAPILSDSLRFSLVNRLQTMNIPVRTHRPSRSLRDEPATQCLLTLAAIAHPDFGYTPSRFEFAQTLMQAIEGMDLIRSRILSDVVYRIHDGHPTLEPFDKIVSSTKERISPELGERYEHLRLWLDEYQQTNPNDLDYFISSLFGEVLSQPGYAFHNNIDSTRIAATLVESIRNFRKVVSSNLGEEGINIGKEYLIIMQEGLVAAQYMINWQPADEYAVLIAPAHTFLISNYPVGIQFWLDIGNHFWAERLYQPITQPFVLSRNWPANEVWTDVQEVETGEQVLYSLVTGLLNRCRQKVYLGLSEYNEQGYEQRGPLLQTFNKMIQSITAE